MSTAEASPSASQPEVKGTSASADPRLLVLTNQQRALLQALQRESSALATIYLGGVCVLADVSNPDRFSLCAHAMRELMEKLPGHLDVSTPAQHQSLKAEVIKIEQAFDNMKRKTKCLNPSAEWEGEIDGALGKFLRRLISFLDWFRQHHPRRQAEFRRVLVRLDGSGRALPEPLSSLNVKAWEAKRDYFQSVAHHKRAGNSAEFARWLDALERFMLDRMVPRTFDDFAEIDALLVEEDAHA